MEMEEKIKQLLQKLRPYLINDGGDLEFVKYENNIVYIKFQGACTDCYLSEFTLKEGIEATIKEEIPEVLEVVSV